MYIITKRSINTCKIDRVHIISHESLIMLRAGVCQNHSSFHYKMGTSNLVTPILTNGTFHWVSHEYFQLFTNYGYSWDMLLYLLTTSTPIIRIPLGDSRPLPEWRDRNPYSDQEPPFCRVDNNPVGPAAMGEYSLCETRDRIGEAIESFRPPRIRRYRWNMSCR